MRYIFDRLLLCDSWGISTKINNDKFFFFLFWISVHRIRYMITKRIVILRIRIFKRTFLILILLDLKFAFLSVFIHERDIRYQLFFIICDTNMIFLMVTTFINLSYFFIILGGVIQIYILLFDSSFSLKTDDPFMLFD